MSSDKISLKESIRNNYVVWFSMLIGQVFFCAIALYLVKLRAMNIIQSNLNSILLYLVPAVAVVCIFTSFYIYKQRMVALKDITDLNQKITDYRSALIVRWALIEGPSFLAIVAYLLTGNYILLGVAAVIIAVFILIMPNQTKFEADLELGWQDKNDLVQ